MYISLTHNAQKLTKACVETPEVKGQQLKEQKEKEKSKRILRSKWKVEKGRKGQIIKTI